jgi:hypothetical protein
VPLRGRARISFARSNHAAVADAVASALREWPEGVRRPGERRLELLRTVSAKLEAGRGSVQSPRVSLRAVERLALWWLSREVLAVTPYDATWELVDALLWED